ncbi:hypothetical protein GCM10009658_61720 [Planotetraspora silvatica]
MVVGSSTQLTAITPAGTGTVNVTVSALSGTSSQTVPYTYVAVPAPVISALAPDQGPVAGGTVVVITGTGFTGATSVRFGSVTASFTVNSGTQITATAPPAAASMPVLVTVTTPGGVSNPAAYAYTGPGIPVVTDVLPDQGGIAGGTVVVITGTGFAGATSVRFGSVTASFTVNSGTQITATAPSGSGPVHVTVTTPGGTSPVSDCTAYTYVGTPVVTALNPNQGPAAGGNSVTIAGSVFTDATDVFFGAVRAPFSVVSDTRIVATAPAGTGSALVTVATAGGASSPGIPYTYV